MKTKVVYKYLITSGESILLPSEAEILKVALQKNQLFLWALVDPTQEKLQRTFIVRGTGHSLDIESRYLRYVDTVFDDMFVWHVFEKLQS